MLKQKEQKQLEKDTRKRKETRYGYLIPSGWHSEKTNQIKSKAEPVGHRAWLEIDRKALEHNVRLFQRLLPDSCQLMPAVKAQAYGLGAVLVAKELNRLGIQAFCVASAEEGIIGTDGNETLTAADMAEAAGTITNETLSRLGSRLERYILGG